MKRIESNTELKSIMDFYGIKQIPVKEGNKDLGVITSNMEYKPGSWKYNKGSEHIAFVRAICKVNEDMEKIEKWRELSKKMWKTHLIYKSDNREEVQKNWFYTGDFKESGVTTSIEDGLLVITGTIDQMRYLDKRTNHHYIYCNGTSIHFDNEELKAAMKLFREYGFYAPYDSFGEYIQMTPIVD